MFALKIGEVTSNGFVRLSTNPSMSTLEVARLLGQVIHLDGIAEVQRLSPTFSENVEKNRYSGLYGTQPFPLHTDLAHWHVPPRYFLLRCLEPAKQVSTQFLHSREVLGPE